MKRIYKLYYEDKMVIGHLDELTKLIDTKKIKDFKLVGVKRNDTKTDKE